MGESGPVKANCFALTRLNAGGYADCRAGRAGTLHHGRLPDLHFLLTLLPGVKEDRSACFAAD